MYLRIKRGLFDTCTDTVLAAASVVGAPLTQDCTGLLLKVVSVTGGQLTKLEDKLRQFIREDNSLREEAPVMELLEEVGRCSHLYVISTSIEVVLVSDRSRHQFQQIHEMNLRLMPKFVDFRDECVRFVTGLDSLIA